MSQTLDRNEQKSPQNALLPSNRALIEVKWAKLKKASVKGRRDLNPGVQVLTDHRFRNLDRADRPARHSQSNVARRR
jgi:hypothetical protein